MKTFNVYKHPAQGFEAVKGGFSWPALFFGVIWLLVKKLWAWSGLWFGVYVVCVFIESVTEKSQTGGGQVLVSLVLAVTYLALWLIPPIKGNKWREENLSMWGYELLSTVKAETPAAAVAQLTKSA